MIKFQFKQALFISVLYLFSGQHCVLAKVYDSSSSVLLFQTKMAKKGSVESQYKLAYMYETGTHVEQNIDNAIDWYDIASAQGHQPSIDRLTYLQVKSGGYKQAHIRWLGSLKEKARARDNDALLLLGQMYAEGTAVNKSLTLSLKLLRRAGRSDRPEIESEITRVKAELDALQQQYSHPDVNVKPDNAPVTSTQKHVPKQKKLTVVSNDSNKHNNQNSTKPLVKVLPAKRIVITKSLQQKNNIINTAKRVDTKTTTLLTDTSVTTNYNYIHPMDIMCGGYNRLQNNCR